MPHQTTFNPVGTPFIELPTIDSTNNYAMGQVQSGHARHGTAYFTHEQTAGKGQRGKSWTSAPGENIILSIVLQPNSVLLSHQFVLSAAIVLACYDLFKTFVPNGLAIKWPNDLYWNDRKAGGILIENVIRGADWEYAIAGMGLNINQVTFPPAVINPVSLKLITGENYDVIELAKQLCKHVEKRWSFGFTNRNAIITDYNALLYKRFQWVRLRKENMVFETVIHEVLPDGKLMTRDNVERGFDFGEVEWILDS